MTDPVATQWSSISSFLEGALPGWVPAEDAERIASYQKYEEIYWSNEEGLAARMRGDNENEVLMPTARMVINTLDRYTAPDFSYVIEGPQSGTVQIAQVAFENLFKREIFFTRFDGAKRKWLTQGDWLWHLYADPDKPLGRRLTLKPVEPAAYFPVYESDVVEGGDPDKVVTVHLAEQVVQGSEVFVSRLTYEKVVDESGTATIFVSHGVFKLEKWWSARTPKSTVQARTALPPEIQNIPVYHLKNIDATQPFGSSDLRGIETVLLGINQTMSDEDMTVAMDGLGVYATDGGPPLDDKGNQTDMIMGPGRIVSNANGLRRIEGATNLAAYGDHYKRLEDAVRSAVGASDAAVGKIDANTAESGIALVMQLAPIMAYTAQKDRTIIGVHTQLFYDLCFWLAVYEELPLLTNDTSGTTVPAVTVTPTIGPKIPENIAAIVDRITSLRSLDPPLISIQTAHEWLRTAGVPVPDDEINRIIAEATRLPSSAALLARGDQEEEDRRLAEQTQDEDVPA